MSFNQRLIRASAALLLALTAGAAQANTDALVSTDWLEDNLKRDDLRVIEVSVKPGQFERGHIPGAVS